MVFPKKLQINLESNIFFHNKDAVKELRISVYNSSISNSEQKEKTFGKLFSIIIFVGKEVLNHPLFSGAK